MGKSVALQEYGRINRELIQGLAAQGRSVFTVPVYQWKLPVDTEPLADAMRDLLEERIQVALFTTGVQVEHFLRFAQEHGKREAIRKALEQVFIGSIGPTCTASLLENGLKPTLEPSHPKMGLLLREAALAYGGGCA